MNDGKHGRNSIRPRGHSSECSSQGVEVEGKVQAETAREKAVLSLEDEAPVKAEVDSDEIEAIDEEEEADVPLCLPAQYQPSRSEFLDHICLEG